MRKQMLLALSIALAVLTVAGISGKKPGNVEDSNQLSSFRFTIASDEMSVGAVGFQAKRQGWAAKRWHVDIAELDCESVTFTLSFGGYGSFEGRFYKMWREDTDLYSFWLVTSEGKRFRLRASNMHGETSLVSCVYDKAGDEWSLVLDHAPIYDYDNPEWVPAGFVSGTVLIERL